MSLWLSGKQTEGRKCFNRSRVFADYNEHKPREYWNYEDTTVQWGNSENYEVVKRLGHGKYSEVYEGMHIASDKKCIIKVLRPVKKQKILREVKILQNLCGGTNIVTLYDVVCDPVTNTPSLIFEAIDGMDFKHLYPKLKNMDVRYYINELLKAIHYAHSHGIMHRDIKPHNIVIDHKQRLLRLIDWGLAEFYHQEQRYNVRVASRYFKGPELLLDMQDYDYSLDMWSLGCVLAGLLFKREPFFRGDSNNNQLVKISQVLGTDELDSWIDKFGLYIDPQQRATIGHHTRIPWESFVTPENNYLASDTTAWDLLDGLLCYDPSDRLTAQEAMDHDYFVPLKSWDVNSSS